MTSIESEIPINERIDNLFKLLHKAEVVLSSIKRIVMGKSREVEQVVLGQMMLDNSLLSKAVKAGLKTTHFTHEPYSKIFDAMTKVLSEAKDQVDLVSVTKAMMDSKTYVGASVLTDIFEPDFRLDDFPVYLQMLLEQKNETPN